MRFLVVLAFVFSTPALAGASKHAASRTTPMAEQMQAGGRTDTHVKMGTKQDCEHMDKNTSNDCCEDGGDMHCRDDESCKTICTGAGFNLSPAVLGTPSNIRQFSMFVRCSPNQLLTRGISPQLSAPPPRA
ncbi:MAG: hypothetical protein COB36_13285 [Alphaproteobacteria bacterium]|nr:MAG: hypothetical protein COB36_13285 [Alphaproteobacteria bacterium]